jgi:hypothetical protein
MRQSNFPMLLRPTKSVSVIRAWHFDIISITWANNVPKQPCFQTFYTFLFFADGARRPLRLAELFSRQTCSSHARLNMDAFGDGKNGLVSLSIGGCCVFSQSSHHEIETPSGPFDLYTRCSGSWKLVGYHILWEHADHFQEQLWTEIFSHRISGIPEILCRARIFARGALIVHKAIKQGWSAHVNNIPRV